jgi:hypothetical protein
MGNDKYIYIFIFALNVVYYMKSEFSRISFFVLTALIVAGILEYSERINRENDLELQQNVAFEFERAQIIMNNILNSYK